MITAQAKADVALVCNLTDLQVTAATSPAPIPTPQDVLILNLMVALADCLNSKANVIRANQTANIADSNRL